MVDSCSNTSYKHESTTKRVTQIVGFCSTPSLRTTDRGSNGDFENCLCGGTKCSQTCLAVILALWNTIEWPESMCRVSTPCSHRMAWVPVRVHRVHQTERRAFRLFGSGRNSFSLVNPHTPQYILADSHLDGEHSCMPTVRYCSMWVCVVF